MNPIKEKKLTNIRAAGKDDAMLLIPPRRMSLEQAIAYIEDDELVEVTPTAVASASATSIRTNGSVPNAVRKAKPPKASSANKCVSTPTKTSHKQELRVRSTLLIETSYVERA